MNQVLLVVFCLLFVVDIECNPPQSAANGGDFALAEAEQFGKKADEFDSIVEEENDKLIEYFRGLNCGERKKYDCLRQDSIIRSGMSSLIEKIMEMGRLSGKAEGRVHDEDEAEIAARMQLDVSMGFVRSILEQINASLEAGEDTDDKDLIDYYQLFLEKAEAAKNS